MLTLWIKTLSTPRFSVQLNPDVLVSVLKQEIVKKLVEQSIHAAPGGILTHKASVLQDDRLLSELGIQNEEHLLYLFDRTTKPTQVTEEQVTESKTPIESKAPEQPPQPRQRSSSLGPEDVAETPANEEDQPMDIPSLAQLATIDWGSLEFPRPDLVELLGGMGFPVWRSKKALLLNMMDPEAAVEWLFEHSDDPNVDDPLTPQENMAVASFFIRQITGRPPPGPNMTEEIKAAVANDKCTFTVTKRNFQSQKWFHCFSCGFVDSEGICESCANVCHKGHKLSEEKGTVGSGFFCDCGASGNCKCCS